MLRITNFPAAAATAAAEEVSSKEKPSPAFPLPMPPSGNRFCFWLLAFLHFANLPINKRSIKYAYQPKRALLSDSLPPPTPPTSSFLPSRYIGHKVKMLINAVEAQISSGF